MAKPRVAVIGGGIFGVTTAIHLAQLGVEVALFERLGSLMEGASYNNQNRLHRGYHYPRDDQTAQECERGFADFKSRYRDCILDNFTNAYFIAANQSHTSPEAYLAFCSRNGLPARELDLSNFTPRVDNVALGILTDEVVYDAALLREAIVRQLRDADVAVRTNVEIVKIQRQNATLQLTTGAGDQAGFDAVVNCSYADINRLTAQLGYSIQVRQYEYTAVAVIGLDWPQPVGVTIMDGAFMTVLPFGRTGDYLLYHVKHTVIERTDEALLPQHWLNKSDAPFSKRDRAAWFHDELIPSCSSFVPDLTRARLMGYLEGPRMVLARREDTDARPSIVEAHAPDYITVFSGKTDHSMWVPSLVAEKLRQCIG